MIRTAQQFCFMGYYGDERAARRAGYVPFSRRARRPRSAMERVDGDRRGVSCMDPSEIPGEELTADIVIVGTGAGGAMLAYELAARGREVLHAGARRARGPARASPRTRPTSWPGSTATVR